MKILLVANKTYRGLPDSLCWYFYEPLKKLGHDVYFYDTVAGEQRGFSAVIETYKPDLIFCIMTGSPDIGPHEPWREILNETKSGRTKTFNWYKSVKQQLQSSRKIWQYWIKSIKVNVILNTPGTRVCPGFRDRMLATKYRKKAEKQLS